MKEDVKKAQNMIVIDSDRHLLSIIPLECLKKPEEAVANSTSSSSEGPWMVDDMVTVKCEDGYLVDHNMPDQQVLCTATGWEGRDCNKGT